MAAPYYQDEHATIYHGDCRDILPLLRTDVVVTDPPYGFAAYETDRPFDPSLLHEWSATYRSVAVFGYPELLVSWSVSAQLVPSEWITWAPSTPRLSSGGKKLPRRSECVAVFGDVRFGARVLRPRSPNGKRLWDKKRSGPSRDFAREGDVWTDAGPAAGRSWEHPNQKPLSVMRKLALLVADDDETILDPFMGSGTTLLAAKNLGRRAIGVEIEEKYCEIAARRLSEAPLCLEVV